MNTCTITLRNSERCPSLRNINYEFQLITHDNMGEQLKRPIVGLMLNDGVTCIDEVNAAFGLARERFGLPPVSWTIAEASA